MVQIFDICSQTSQGINQYSNGAFLHSFTSGKGDFGSILCRKIGGQKSHSSPGVMDVHSSFPRL